MLSKRTARLIANWIFREASTWSDNGSWVVYYYEIERNFELEHLDPSKEEDDNLKAGA